MIKVIKKDNTTQEWDRNKIFTAINKSAERCVMTISKEEFEPLIVQIENEIMNENPKDFTIVVNDLHHKVESALELYNQEIAKSYKDYRNYKKDFTEMLDGVYKKAQSIMYRGDKENSNTDSALVSTKRSLIYNALNEELYTKFFLNTEEKQAINDGYIYIHDKNARRDTLNCCLADVKAIMTGGFEMSNMWYNEPKSIDTACDVLGDIIMMSAGQMYGGYSLRADDLLAPYVEKSYNKYKEKYKYMLSKFGSSFSEEELEDLALTDTIRDLEQGIQGLEYKLNSVASSRGDYVFVTFAFGVVTNRFEKMVCEAILKTRMNGQGKEGKKKQVLFPKLVFLYDKEIHGKGKKHYDLFELGIECSGKSMYPDWLSLTGEGYVPEMYKKYNKIVYPMG